MLAAMLRLPRPVRLCAALAVVGIALASPAAAEPPRIAVVNFLAVNVPAEEVDRLDEALARTLARQGVDARGGAAVRAEAGQVTEVCIATPACAARLATTLAADRLVATVVVRVGDDLQIDLTLIDGATGAAAGQARVQVGPDDDAAARFAMVAPTLVPRVEPPPPDRDRPPPDVDRPPPDGGAVVPAAPAPAPRGRRVTTLTAVSGGVAIAGLATGAMLGLSARGRYRECEASVTCSPGELDSIRARALGADVALGIGVTALAFTAWRYLTSAGAAPLVVPASDGGAVVVTGRF